MRLNRLVNMVEAHAEGEIGRVITASPWNVPGKNVLEKMKYLNTVNDAFRKFCVLEPRGFSQMSTNLLLAASTSKADAAFLIMQGDKVHAMSGSNAMCVATVLVEMGMVPVITPVTNVRLETPAGIILAKVAIKNAHASGVSIDMVPAFVEDLDVGLDIDGFGKIKCDIAFGGIYYALVDVSQLKKKITKENARDLVEIGCCIHRQAKKVIKLNHPDNPLLNSISYIMFTGFNESGERVNATVLPPGRLDRSPCGTGTAARLVCELEKKTIKIGDKVDVYSVIGSRFSAILNSVNESYLKSMANVTVSGRAWVFGFHQIGCDPQDPFINGHMLSDTWGNALDLVE